MKSIILLLVFLTGCSSVPATQVVERTRNVPIELDERLFTITPVPAPPDVAYYMSVPIDVRESLLTEYIIELSKGYDSCNIQLYRLKKAHDAAIDNIRK